MRSVPFEKFNPKCDFTLLIYIVVVGVAKKLGLVVEFILSMYLFLKFGDQRNTG